MKTLSRYSLYRCDDQGSEGGQYNQNLESSIIRTRVVKVHLAVPLTKLRPSSRNPVQAHDRQRASIHREIWKAKVGVQVYFLAAT